MGTKIFVNLAVKDLKRSIGFFTQMGYTFDPQFTDQNATCMIVTEDIYVMLLVKDFFRTFTKKEVTDPAKATEVILTLSADSREQVDDLVNKAIRAGATSPNDIQDQGWMYGRGFYDLDGHHWEIMYMDAFVFSQ
ncbi:MAG TPA: VOC family protein [Ohtaekwangia sp.]|uniref:VOC family protein n=1 Tax=Ohtaekwangia sp. TaxID=2066019 RepID=UPI002F94B79E